MMRHLRQQLRRQQQLHPFQQMKSEILKRQKDIGSRSAVSNLVRTAAVYPERLVAHPGVAESMKEGAPWAGGLFEAARFLCKDHQDESVETMRKKAVIIFDLTMPPEKTTEHRVARTNQIKQAFEITATKEQVGG